MRHKTPTQFIRLVCCLLAINLSLSSIASATMMGLIPVEVSSEAILVQQLENPTASHSHSTESMSHASMMESSDHAGAHEVSCDEQLCIAPVSMLPADLFVLDSVLASGNWMVFESAIYVSNLYALLYKPPRV